MHVFVESHCMWTLSRFAFHLHNVADAGNAGWWSHFCGTTSLLTSKITEHVNFGSSIQQNSNFNATSCVRRLLILFIIQSSFNDVVLLLQLQLCSCVINIFYIFKLLIKLKLRSFRNWQVLGETFYKNLLK